jgi:hypothetical protein
MLKKDRAFFGIPFFLLSFLFFLGACAGNDAKLERARYLLGSGQPKDAEKAKKEVEGLLESSSGAFRVEVVEVYAGALLSAAGFNGVKILVNVLHRDEDASAAFVLRSILEDSENALQNVNKAVDETRALVGTTVSGDRPEPLLGRPTDIQEAYEFVQVSPMPGFSDLSESYRKRAFYAAGISNLYRGLFILLKVSGFFDDQFSVSDCEEFLKDPAQTGAEGVDAISLSFRRAQAYLQDAGLQNSNKLMKLIEDLQRGNDPDSAIDYDQDGFVGEGLDLTVDEKSELVCKYLNDSL